MFDWMSVEIVRHEVERIEEMLASDNSKVVNAADMTILKEGTKSIIHVEITNGKMASLLFNSLYAEGDNHIGLPGMKVVLIGTPDYEKRLMIDKLKEIIVELET